MSKSDFTNEYVIKETIRHMEKCVKISQQKTLQRLPEFQGDAARTAEAFLALNNLNKLGEMLAEIRKHNPELIGESK